jgi:ACR3 family arsenite efflux pump ArsB
VPLKSLQRGSFVLQLVAVPVSRRSYRSVCPQHFRAASRRVAVVMTTALCTAGSSRSPATTTLTKEFVVLFHLFSLGSTLNYSVPS